MSRGAGGGPQLRTGIFALTNRRRLMIDLTRPPQGGKGRPVDRRPRGVGGGTTGVSSTPHPGKGLARHRWLFSISQTRVAG